MSFRVTLRSEAEMDIADAATWDDQVGPKIFRQRLTGAVLMTSAIVLVVLR